MNDSDAFYGGAGNENPRTTRAVRETRGMVMRRKGGEYLSPAVTLPEGLICTFKPVLRARLVQNLHRRWIQFNRRGFDQLI